MIIIRIILMPVLFYYWRQCKKLYKKWYKDNTYVTYEEKYDFLYSFVKKFFFIFGIKVAVLGKDNIKTTPSLVVSNHQSNLDVSLIIYAMKQNKKAPYLGFIGKEELNRSFIFKYMVRLLETVLLNRKSLRQAIEAFGKAKDIINKKKQSLLIFPEGTRSKTLTMSDFKAGAFKIAYSTAAPIQPIVIYNSYKYAKFNFKKKFVVIKILPIIKYHKFINLKTTDLSKLVYNQIENELKKGFEKDEK